MFKIYDGREAFYQWDIDQKIIVADRSITQVHFCNRTEECALICECYEHDGNWVADVPNILLQDNWRIRVYAYDGCATRHDEKYDVKPRSKPDTYVYTETEVLSYETIAKRMDAIETDIEGVAEEVIKEYLKENDIQVDLTGYATEQYVNEQIGKIDIPETDLSDYAKKSDIPSLAPYATKAYVNDAIKINVPDMEGYATEDYVDEAVDNIDLTSYATKQYVIDAIGDISSFDIEIVSSLSAITNINEHTIYYVPNGNHYDEYMYVNGQWEMIGSTELDLTGYATEEYVQEQIENIDIPDPDLTAYAKKTDIPSLEGYATQDYVDIQISYINSEGVKEIYVGTEAPVAGSSYEVWINPDEKAGFATIEYVDDAIANIEHPTVDLSNYYTKTEVDAKIPNVSGYVTETEMNAAIIAAFESVVLAEEEAY